MEDIDLSVTDDNPAYDPGVDEGHVASSHSNIVYRSYRRRWGNLTLLALLNISNGILWISFAPVASTTQAYFNVSLTAVNWLSLIFMVVSIPMTFAATWALDAKGLRYALIVGAILNTIGGWIRFFSTFLVDSSPHGAFALLFVGQTVAALAQMFFLSAPTKLAAVWFSERQRATANMLASIANPLGIAVGSGLSPVFVSIDDPTSVATMLWVFALPATLVLILTVTLLQNRPPTPPSASANLPEEPFTRGLHQLIRSPQFLVVFIAFGVGVGIFNALTTLLEQILSPRGYSQDDAGLLGAAIIGAGLVGAAVAGPVDKTGRFAPMMKILLPSATLAVVWFSVASHKSDNMASIAVALAVFGACGFAIIPVCMELGVESSYPVPEGTSAGFLWLSGQVFGIVFIVVMDALRNDNLDRGLYFLIAMAAVACLVAFSWHGPYRRAALDDIPALALTEVEAQRLSSGQSVGLLAVAKRNALETPVVQDEIVCAMLHDRAIALAEINGGEIRPVRVFNL